MKSKKLAALLLSSVLAVSAVAAGAAGGRSGGAGSAVRHEPAALGAVLHIGSAGGGLRRSFGAGSGDRPVSCGADAAHAPYLAPGQHTSGAGRLGADLSAGTAPYLGRLLYVRT